MDKRELLSKAVRLADTIMRENQPVICEKWQYDRGVCLMGMAAVYEKTGDKKYFDYIKKSMDYFINNDGSINKYDPSLYNLDHINNGKNCLWLYNNTGEQKYLKAAERLIDQLNNQPRTKSGTYWHKLIYPNQVWLDGVYMAEPFSAQYAKECGHSERFDDVVTQFVNAERLTYEPRCGLNAHACDESKTAFWADKNTGRSLNVWGRAMAWFTMAIVDALDFIPPLHSGRKTLIKMLDKIMSNVVLYQDENGCWYQVLDNRRSGNYPESTCTCMFAYTLAKALRLGYLDEKKFRPHLESALGGILGSFIREDGPLLYITDCCAVSGLGPEGNLRRDGTLDYYFSEPIVENDCKAVGPFLKLICDLI